MCDAVKVRWRDDGEVNLGGGEDGAGIGCGGSGAFYVGGGLLTWILHVI